MSDLFPPNVSSYTPAPEIQVIREEELMVPELLGNFQLDLRVTSQRKQLRIPLPYSILHLQAGCDEFRCQGGGAMSWDFNIELSKEEIGYAPCHSSLFSDTESGGREGMTKSFRLGKSPTVKPRAYAS